MKVPFPGGNLGDALWLTPLARYHQFTVQLRKGDKRAEAISRIFDAICPVEFIDNPPETPKTNDDVHVTQKILRAHGVFKPYSIPFITLTLEEITWARDFLKTYGDPNDLIVIINNNSGTNDPQNPRAKYVCPPHQYMQELCDFYIANGKKVLQFGPSKDYYDRDVFVPLVGASHIRGLSVRQLAACYHVIGKMISGDTGDYHLMIATGGRCITLVPEENLRMGYSHSDLLYGFSSAVWGNENPRVSYLLHHEYTEIIKQRVWL